MERKKRLRKCCQLLDTRWKLYAAGRIYDPARRHLRNQYQRNSGRGAGGNDKIKEVADDNVAKVLGELEGDYRKFETRMILVLVINAILVIAIIILLPIRNYKNVIIFIMVLAMAFMSNVVNMAAVAAKKESMGKYFWYKVYRNI